PFEGQRKALADSARELESITISLIQPAISEALSAQRDYLSTFDDAFAQIAQAAIGELQAKVTELDWQETPIGENAQKFSAAFKQAQQTIERINAANRQIVELARQLQESVDAQSRNLEGGLLARTEADAQQARSSAQWIMGLRFVIVAGLLTITLLQASRVLVARLHNATQLLSQVASGDLTGKLPVGNNPKDEFYQLADAANRMIQGLGGIVSQVVKANGELGRLHGHLGDAMRQLGDNSLQVEMQTEQAASASQQISATLN